MKENGPAALLQFDRRHVDGGEHVMECNTHELDE
jgi:hypothetical protein